MVDAHNSVKRPYQYSVAIGRPEAYYDGHGEERAGKGQRIIRIVAVESEDR